MRNILTSSLELNNFKIATIEASVDDTTHASVTVPTLARGYRKGDTVTLLSEGNIVIKTEGGDILGYITISLDTGASIYDVGFNIVSMVVNTEYPLTEDFNYIYYIILYTPPTKRLSLSVETDGVTSSDGDWIDNNGNIISYVDMPEDYGGIWLTGSNGNIYNFVPADSDWNPDSSLGFKAGVSPSQGVVFRGIEYKTYGGTAFDVNLTQTYISMPTTYTQGFLQDGDKMVMVFETQTVPTFTVVNLQNPGGLTNAITASVRSGEGLSEFNIGCDVDNILLGSDGYYYCAVLGVVSWRPQDSRNCYVRISISGDEWSPTYTVEDYYIETGTPGDSSFCNYFSSGDSTYIPAIASYVGDPSIVDVQTLGEYIYNKLQ